MIGTERVRGQAGITAVPFMTLDTDVRSIAMGTSNVALPGFEGSSYINPANIGYRSSSVYFDFLTKSHSWDDMSLTSIRAGVSKTKWNLETSFTYFNLREQAQTNEDSPSVINRFNNHEFYLKNSANYIFDNGLRVGFGLTYIHSDIANGTTVSRNRTRIGRAISVDLGLTYQRNILDNDLLVADASAGWSLTNFGSRMSYAENAQSDPLPMDMRGGFGLTFESKDNLNGVAWLSGAFSVSALQGLADIDYIEQRNSNGDIVRIADADGPFEALFDGWTSFTLNRFVSDPVTYNAWEQMIVSSGVELGILNSIYLRYGRQNGQELNSFESYNAIGIGINLFYLSFDYAYTNYNNEGIVSDTLQEGSFWQIRARIPLPFNDWKPAQSIWNAVGLF